MASETTATKPLKPVETIEAVRFDEALESIETAIQQVVDTFGATAQRARLKGIRALAYQALVESIEAGDLEALTQRAIGKVGNLPTGWTVTPTKRAPEPERKPRATKAEAKAAPATRGKKGATVATKDGVIIAEQRHVDG